MMIPSSAEALVGKMGGRLPIDGARASCSEGGNIRLG
jgi:hypothetical protein